MATSPSPLNYRIGRGIVKWKGALDVSYRFLGNAPSLTTTPAVTRLPHYNAQEGIRRLDLNPVVQLGMALKVQLEEITPENLALAFLGSQAGSIVNILDVGNVTGALRFIGTNSTGDKEQADFPNVTIAPGGALEWIGQQYSILEVDGEVLALTTGTGIGGLMVVGSFGLITHGITDEVVY
jgi:hypothetical protein